MPGEFIVLCRDGNIEGLAIAEASPIPDQPKPLRFPFGDKWHDSGWLLPVSFVLFGQRRSRSELTKGLFTEKVKYAPLFNDPRTGKSAGTEIYLTKVRDADGAP